MSLAFRPLFAVLLMALASGSDAAPKKKVQVAPAGPTACSDFYAYVNNPWLLAHPLPLGVQSFSRWDELNDTAAKQTVALIANTSASSGVASRLLSNLVASASDPAARDAATRATAQPLLAQVNGIRKARDVAKVVAALHAAGVPVLFGFDALRDPETGQARATLYPGGLGLPDASYYASTAPELQPALAAYRNYVGELLKFAGVAENKRAEQVTAALAIEQSIAAAMGAASSQTLPSADAIKAYPALSLGEFMQAQGTAPALVVINQPAFFQSIDRMLVKPSIAQWQAYLRAQVAHSFAPTLASDPRLPHLAALKLAPSVTPATFAADRLVAVARDEAFELLSSAYAETYLTRSDEQKAEAIAEAVRAAMGRALERATWLSPEGKAAAQTKLSAMRLAIGKPVEPVSFEGLVLDRTNYAGNLLALRRWNRTRSLQRLNSAVWPWPVMQAQPAIGYQQGENRLIVTAAALRAPALEGRSVASDYGSYGALVAQQMSLAFADFTQSDGSGLAYRQAGLLPQYNAYPASPITQVDGLRTQRQNAADLAAIEIAIDALNAQGPQTEQARKEFFTAWAQIWARQENASALVASQAQSQFAPARWRANGPLVNTPAFASTFACKKGQPMFKDAKDQLAIWR